MDSTRRTGAAWVRCAMAWGLLGALTASWLGCASMMLERKAPRAFYPVSERRAAALTAPDAAEGAPPPARASLLKGVTVLDLVSGGEFGYAGGFPGGMPDAPQKPKDAVPGGGAPDAKQPPAPKRLVIYTAQFAILVSNVEDSMKELLAKIETWDGYLQTADLKKVTFRIPAANFDKAVEDISQMGVVTDKQIRAEDVTARYRDLQLRLEVAETSRKRLLAILEKAQKAEDILKIENEIRRLTEEIESMKAQLRTLADQIAYSTITVELTAKAPQVRHMPRRRASYFPWINRIGAEYVMRNF